MRKVLICLAWVLMFFPVLVSGQSILAGQASGDKIVYHDIEDLQLYSPGWNTSDEEDIDLNDDGQNDLRLMTSCTYYSHTGELFVSANANAYPNCEYSTLADPQYWVRKHESGEVIDGSLIWYTEPDPYFTGTFANNSGDGQFLGNGYMAYRLLGTDTIYGWIRIYCNPPSLTVYEFAYYDIHLGLPGSQETQALPSFYINKGELTAVIPEELLDASCQLNCYDLSGRCTWKMQPRPGIQHYPLSNWQTGMYVLRFTDRHGRVYSNKIMVP